MSNTEKVEMKISELSARLIELGRILGDGTLRVIVIDHEPMPDVDIFLTEDEFIKNVNPEFREFEYVITKELCRALYDFGFLPRAGFLSKNVKLIPQAKTATEAVSEKDNSFLEWFINRKQTIYDAQKKGMLTCKENLEYIGVRNVAPIYNQDIGQYQEMEPVYLLSQVNELRRVILHIADRAIKGVHYYNEKIRDFENLIQSDDVKEESIQNFLEENKWIFGTEYVTVKPKKELSHEYVVDFLLQRFDNNWEIVEIELPTDDVFTRKLNVTAKVTNSIGQIQNAQEFITKSYEFLKTHENIEAYRPKGTLFIGNKLSDKGKNRLEIINKGYSDIKIATYQDLLYKVRKQIELVEKLIKHNE